MTVIVTVATCSLGLHYIALGKGIKNTPLLA